MPVQHLHMYVRNNASEKSNCNSYHCFQIFISVQNALQAQKSTDHCAENKYAHEKYFLLFSFSFFLVLLGP